MKLWKQIWNTTIDTGARIPWTEAIKGGADAIKAISELGKVLSENKAAKELAPIVGRVDSLLDVLNSPLGKTVSAAVPFLPLATGILGFIVKQTQREPSLELSVALVSQAAYLESLKRFMVVHPNICAQLQDTDASATVAKRIQRLGENLEVDGKPVSFDERNAHEVLLCFHDSPLAKAFNHILNLRLQESGFDATKAITVTERVSRGTHRYMKEAVVDARDTVPRLAVRYGEGWLRDLEAYASLDRYLDEVIAPKPLEKVFDEDFTFRDIYVPLAVQPVKDGEVVSEAEGQHIEHWATDLLSAVDKQGQVMFIQAGPGQGKSVFCRMFADWVWRELHPIWTPILIRLRDILTFELDFDKTLSAAVGWDFVTNDSGWLTDRNTRFLFLLDGFDELIMERGTGGGVGQLLDQVEQFQRRSQENRERGHRVLLTGRPLALSGLERIMPVNFERVAIQAMTPIQQEQWLSRWEVLFGPEVTMAYRDFLTNERCPEAVKRLAQEPLLLYLLGAMHRDASLSTEALGQAKDDEVKVDIYMAVVDWVLHKQRSEGRLEQRLSINPKLTGLNAEDLRSVWMEAGLCVVQSGNERARVAMLENRLEQRGDKKVKALLEDARESPETSPLAGALTAFYLKTAEGADNSVEFFHKSFGEFLCAERLAESLEDWTQAGRRRRTHTISDAEFEWQVYDLLGYGHLTVEIMSYLMVLLKRSKAVDWSVLFDRLNDFYLRWSHGEFIDVLEADGQTLPIQKARQLQRHNIRLGQRQVDVYTGLNVLVLLLELHRYGQLQDDSKEPLVFFPCGDPGVATEFESDRLLRIIGYSQCCGTDTFIRELSWVLSSAKLQGTNLEGANLEGANLGGANLEGAKLQGADLEGVDLRFAKLQGANLQHTYLGDIDLRNADLRRADLYGANIRFADLEGTNLEGTNLEGANFYNAKLQGTKLQGANLYNAKLLGAKLLGANLQRTYLYDTNLRVADLESIDLQDANLRFARLEGAKLQGADLRFARLEGADLQGADLRFARLEGTDLQGARLQGANLEGANLQGARLQGAKLQGAKLQGANLYSADLHGVSFDGVNWNNQTCWANTRGLHEARDVPEALSNEPKFAAAKVLSRGYSCVKQGNIEAALTDYSEAQQLDPEIEISANSWNELCRGGSLHGMADAVLFAGEKAVELAPQNGNVRDTLGFARALTGDIARAIEDFQAALDSGQLSSDSAAKRQRWLEALRTGGNPFTPQVMEALRKEEG